MTQCITAAWLSRAHPPEALVCFDVHQSGDCEAWRTRVAAHVASGMRLDAEISREVIPDTPIRMQIAALGLTGDLIRERNAA